MPSLGEAYIEVHADTGPFDRELAASIEKALIAAEAAMRARGRDAGNAFGEGVERGVHDHTTRIGDDMGDDLSRAARRAGERASRELNDAFEDNVDFDFNADIDIGIPDFNRNDLNNRERELTGWASRVSRAVGSAFESLGSLFDSLFSGSGRMSKWAILFNPGVLTALFGLLSGVLFGLLGVLNPLGALLAALPAAVFGLGAEVMVIAAAFSGISNSIGKIFGADTLGEAMKVASRFEGGVRNFLEGLAYVAQLWRTITTVVQQAFFQPFKDSLKYLALVLSQGDILAGIRNLAYSMGKFADSLVKAFSGPAFQHLAQDLFPAIARIVDKLSGPFITMIEGLFRLMRATLPFLEGLATLLGNLFTRFGKWMTKISTNGQLKKFLEDMYPVVQSLGEVFRSLGGFIVSVLDTLRTSGTGENFLKTLSLAFTELTKFFSSKEGQFAIVSMTEAAMGLIAVLTLMIIGFSVAWASIMAFLKALTYVSEWLWEHFIGVLKAIGDFFSFLGEGVHQIGIAIEGTFMRMGATIVAVWTSARMAVTSRIESLLTLVRSIPTRISNFFSNIGATLYSAGRNLIQGLINGIKAAIPGLQSALNWITEHLPSWKGPPETDKKILKGAGFQVMQGFREGIANGAKGVYGDLQNITGMIGMNANANSFNFGPGAIVNNFSGVAPSTSTANAMGRTTGSAIASTVNSQNTRASVRAI